MPLRISATTIGLDKAKSRLKGLPKVIRNRAIRQALRKVGTIGARRMRALTPVDTRQSRKSSGVKVKLYRTTGRVVLIIGPRSGFKVKRGRRYHNPTRIYNILDYRLDILSRVRSECLPLMRSTMSEHVTKVIREYEKEVTSARSDG
jgi:hypothetical protein